MRNFITLVCVFAFTHVQLIAQQQVLLHDEFNDNSNKWPEGESSVSKFHVDSKRSMYEIRYNLKNTIDACTSWIDCDLKDNRNFKITALFYKEKGVTNYGYGLIWGGRDDNYYSYLVSPGGYYCVGKVVDGIWNDITPDGWILSETVEQGRHAFNKLTISKIGDTYHFEVNDRKVATMKCGPFFGNKIGFNVNNKQKIMVDWIKVEYI